MRKKHFLKNNKGAITLYVLLACLFFLIALVSVNVYTKNKEIAIDNQYQKVKEGYEKDVGNEGQVYEEIISKPKDMVANSETALFSTEYGRIDVIWLDGTTNNVTSTPNEPALSAKNDSNVEEAMTPVTWTYDSTTKTWNEDPTYNSGEWYNYKAGNGTEDNTESHWANAKTANGSYFVWIPRYAYRITYYESETSTTPTGYYDGYGMWSAKDRSLKYELDEGIETVDYNGNKYIVHPAFMDDTNKKDSDGNSLEDYERGGWDSNLSGFWFAKYEMSGSGTTTSSSSTLKSEPGVASLTSTSIGDQYRYSRTANYGYTGKTETLTSNGTSYTYTSYMNSHLVKNSEWGAVAYLTQSQYGRNGHEISVNQCSDYITGVGRGLKAEEDETGTATGTSDINNSTYSSSAITDAQKYNGSIGVLSSTTGNVYGVYDMSGGAWEYAASYDELGSSASVAGSFYGLYMTQESMDSTGNYINTKYITTYSNGTTSYSGNKIIYGLGKIGDSTKEVNKGGAYSGTSKACYDNWFSDYSYVVGSGNPFFIRGRYYYNGSNAGVFSSYYLNGSSSSINSFRVVLCP